MISILKKWFMDRFIFITEVIGYILCAIIFSGIIASVFMETEILLKTTGKLDPVTTTVNLESESVLLKYLVDEEKWVEPGTPICTVVTDPQERQLALVKKKLEYTLALLNSANIAENEKLITETLTIINGLPPVAKMETLTAPAAGYVKFIVKLTSDISIQPSEPIATIYNTNAFELNGSVPVPKNTAAPTPGCLTRVKFPEWPDKLIGTIKEASTENATAQVSMRFDDIPKELSDTYRAVIFNGKKLPGLDASTAEIVVGRQSWFKKLFSKK